MSKAFVFSKRGSLELGMNFIVVTIISIVLLGIGIALILRGSSAWEREYESVKSLQEAQAKSELSKSGANVKAIPSIATIDRQDSQFFTVGITNDLGRDSYFKLFVVPVSEDFVDYYVLYEKTSFEIRQGETVFMPIKIEPEASPGKKSYIFNVCVYDAVNMTPTVDCPSTRSYGDAQKIILNVN